MKHLRELDTLIASQIMGLRILDKEWPCYQEPECGTWQPAIARDRVDKHPSFKWAPQPVYGVGVDEKFEEVIPFYSSDISSAMEVWDKLRKSGKFCCLELDFDYHYVWGAKITLADGGIEDDWLHEDYKHEPHIHVENANPGLESLALCICVTALMTVGVDVVGEYGLVDLVKRRKKGG